MSDSRPRIDLLAPGLLGPIPSLRELDKTPSAPVLEKYLSRASMTRIQAQDFPGTVFNLFGLEAAPGDDLPTAPYSHIADGGEVGTGYLLHASPVHLRPDGDGLLLFDSGVMGIEQEEALELAELFNSHFSDMSFQLTADASNRWYLHLEQEPALNTSSLREVIGRNIDQFMPQGEDASKWRSIMNEVQMLFYSAKVNILRDGQGQFPINGIWLHGGGYHQAMDSVSYDVVCGGDPLAQGMASTSGTEQIPLPTSGGELLEIQGRALVVNDMLDRPTLDADPLGWLEALEEFEDWLESLLAGVRFKRLEYLNIYPCDGSCYRLDSAAMRRFWRFKRAISSYLS